MSFNIRFGRALDGRNRWARRRTLVFATIRNAEPDIVGLQEVLDFQLAELLGALPGYVAVGAGRETTRGGEHVPVLVRAGRFAVERHGDFWLSATPDEAGSVGWDAAMPRICTWTALEDSRGGRFAFANTHFDHQGPAARVRSAELLLERIASIGLPMLIVGDINAGEDSEPLRRLLDSGLRDTYRVRDPDGPGGTWHGFGSVEARSKIDYVLCDGGWEVLEADIVRESFAGRFPSDHYPVTAAVRLVAP